MTTRKERAERQQGRVAGQQAGKNPKRDHLIPTFGAHDHEDGEHCQGLHRDERCTAYACGNWATQPADALGALCPAHYGKTVVCFEADGTPVMPARIEPDRVKRKPAKPTEEVTDVR